MSRQPSTSKRGKRKKGTDGGEGCNGGGRAKVYLHAVTVEAAALLEDTGNTRLLQNVKKESRADVVFDPNPSPVPGMKILIIRGLPKQIEKAVSLISQAIGTKETISAQAQTFWLQWVQDAFPDLESRPYFLPPVYINRVPMTRQSIAGQDVLVLQVEEGQVGKSNHLSPSAQSDKNFQPTLPENVDQDIQHTPPGQCNQCIHLTSPEEISQNIQATSPGQCSQYSHPTPLSSLYIQQISPKQCGQYLQSKPAEQDGQYTAALRQAGQAGQNILHRQPAQAGHRVQQTSPQQVDQHIWSPPRQTSQNIQPRDTCQYIQSIAPGQPGQYIQPTLRGEVGQDIKTATARQFGRCIKLTPPGPAGQYILHRHPEQSGQYIQPISPQHVNQYTQLPPGQASQNIRQTILQQGGQYILNRQSEQAGRYIQPTTTGKTGQYIQPPLHRHAGELNQSTQSQQSCQSNQSTQSQQSCQSNQSTQSQQSCQSNQSTPLINARQCILPAMVNSAPKPLNSQPTRVQDSDVRDDAAMQRVLVCLQTMAEVNGEIMIGLSQLQFGQYLGEPCYAAAAAHLPLPHNLSNASYKAKEGTFDALLIHRQYGFVVCDVKSFGDNLDQLSMPPVVINAKIRKKLSDAVSQLDKAEAMLSHLVSDIAPGLCITKTIAFPNLTAHQVQQAISGDTQLITDLCRCLKTTDSRNITDLCLFSDQLSDPKTPCDVSSHVLRELGHWWQRRVAGAGPDSHVTDVIYKILVARFCGPATTVSVPCTSPPRLVVKTLGQAVWCTGECYTAVITLFPEQVHLLHTAPPTLFVTGPPGTGKTVVLLLMAIQWLRCGHPVYIVSTWEGGRAACTMLYHLLLQTIKKQLAPELLPSQLQLLHVNLGDHENVEKAVNDLSQVAREGSLYILIDEMGHEDTSHLEAPKMKHIKTFCEELLTQVPRLHLWAASCYHKNSPPGWQVEYLTRPLRSPPAVVREVKKGTTITKGLSIKKYSERGVPDHTDGPPVRRLHHGGQGHSGYWPGACVTCGREVASFLHSLRVGVTENNELTTLNTVTSITGGTAPPCLQWRDVLVLHWDDGSGISSMVKGLQEAGIPVRVMFDDDIEDVATARSDVVWVAEGNRLRGLERKVVVCLGNNGRFLNAKMNCYGRLRSQVSRELAPFRSASFHSISRCTSQLMIVE